MSNLTWPREPALGGWYTGEEQAVAAQVIAESADWRTGFRARACERQFEAAFTAYIGTSHAVATSSGGAALDMVLESLDLEPGDEVISCAINFVGTHVSVLRHGGRLILCEPDPVTLNIDPADVEHRISPRTRAIVATHMNGMPADIGALLEVARRHPHPRHGPPQVIGDAARACGAIHHGARVGTAAWASIFSFQSKKPMTTLGNGGMVVTDDALLASRIRRLRSFGKNQELGANRKMGKVEAAVGLVQLRRLDEMNAARVALARARTTILRTLDGLIVPVEPDGLEPIYYRYNALVPPHLRGHGRDRVIQTLEGEFGVGCIVADPPTYRTHPLIAAHVAGQRCPVADDVADRLLCPFLHPLLTPADNTAIAEAVIDAITRLS
ncbi:DegT/DnrJ/EryC1/StrS aminotransferase [Sphaerisporangium album]|uniref:DegT/DnrJ/EryC1/StrS aminotransferase n=1 Tax=Sphaerisporangium album TaxID=509200 RepID=A0A367EKL1_9ACTN|nr:DegT/DnrJ/EryC1/StrS family aminotransferase [Sphaerisporangium album]RCG17917.1 DegT/DnrJ/EryC1/StrS aminotransferase [Sphaerisporangium album]